MASRLLGNHYSNPSSHQPSSDSVGLMEDFIMTEIEHGVMLGPFKDPPFTPWTLVSPMMVRPKRDSSKKRVIVDLSYPLGASVNTGKGQYQGQPMAYTLPTIIDLADQITMLGTGAFIWCVDLARAYR